MSCGFFCEAAFLHRIRDGALLVIPHAGVATVGEIPTGSTDTVEHIVVELACTQSYTFDLTVLAAWLPEVTSKSTKS